MMLRAIAVLALFTLTLVCASVVAGETGRIEVEVVYKDTGEPVEGVQVEGHRTTQRRRVQRRLRGYTSHEARCLLDAVPFGSYDVTISNPYYPDEVRSYGSTKFDYSRSETAKSVSLAADDPVARVRFMVDRGCRLSGTIRRSAGGPLPRAWVAARWPSGRGGWLLAAALTDNNGQFQMLGITRSVTPTVSVMSAYWLRRWPHKLREPVSGSCFVWREVVELAGEQTVLDLEVSSATLHVELELVQPVWPFPTDNDACAGVWFSANPERDRGLPDIMIRPLGLSPEPDSTRARTIYRVHLEDLPVDQVVTVGLGVYVHGPDPATPRVVPDYRVLKTVTTREGPQEVKTIIAMPYARLSRIAPGLGVLVVVLVVGFVFALHRRAMRRRSG